MSNPIKRYQEYNSIPYTVGNIIDTISEYIDDSKIEILSTDQNILKMQYRSIYPCPIYTDGINVYDRDGINPKSKIGEPDRSNKTTSSYIYLKISIPHPFGMRGSLDIDSYTRGMITDYFKRFIDISNDVIDTSLYVSILSSNKYNNPLSTSVLRFEFGT